MYYKMFEGLVKAGICITKIPVWVPSLLKTKKKKKRLLVELFTIIKEIKPNTLISKFPSDYN